MQDWNVIEGKNKNHKYKEVWNINKSVMQMQFKLDIEEKEREVIGWCGEERVKRLVDLLSSKNNHNGYSKQTNWEIRLKMWSCSGIREWAILELEQLWVMSKIQGL